MVAVLFKKRPILLASLSLCLLSVLTACATAPNGKSWESSFAADPNLPDNALTLDQSSPQGNTQPNAIAQLPEDFPSEIPIYPEVQLQAASNSEPRLARWTSPDPSNLIQSYYQKEFQSNNWEIVTQNGDDTRSTLVARRDDLQVNLSVQPTSRETPATSESPSTDAATELTIEYNRNAGEVAIAENSTSEPDSLLRVGNIGQRLGLNSPGSSTADNSTNTPQTTSVASEFTDIEKVPQFRPYIEDLAVLGVLKPDSASKSNSASGAFEPNKAVTRRQYARWLVAANNQVHANRPGQQVRLASGTSQPAFSDVPRSDPDFAAIQGLAEAGLIPSTLSGDSTNVLFRPDAPLTRENLVLWKTPLDTRSTLPKASVEAVQETWGFQDSGKVNPTALRAVLADFQNGESSNIRRVFGYTTLFQPQKTVTRAEAAAALWYFGSQGEGLSAKEAQQLKRQPSQPTAQSEAPPTGSENQ
jgi:hypothetical protein